MARAISTKGGGASAIGKNRKFTIEDLWKEVQDLRSALEAEKEKTDRLTARVKELERENEKLRKGQWATENFLQGKIRKLEKDVSDRDEKLKKKDKQLKWLRKKVFGDSSEKQKAQVEAKAQKAKSGEKRSRGQQPGSEGHGRTDRSNVRVADTIQLSIPGGCRCSECGKAYLVLPVTEDSSLFEIAVDLFQTIFQQLKYVSQCKCLGKRIITAPAPERLYPRTDIGNSLWVYLITQKFLHGVPTNRTLKDLSLYGFSLAEGTVTGGLEVINGLLDSLYQGIVDHCRGADLWNADETTWRIFDSGKKRWWLWLIASNDAVAYILDPSRSKRVPSEFFAGSVGILMTDRFASYKALHEEIRKAWCWVHVRRDFLNIFNGVKHLKAWAKKWLKRIAELFVLGERRFRMWEQDKDWGPDWDAVEIELRDLVEKLETEWKRELCQKGLHEEQKTVLRSLKRHWPGLTLFLEDPRIPLHNNRAERMIRNPVILRKNSFGSGTEWAGKLAAKLFSIFQTWLINGLDPQALLLDYFNECSKTPGRAPPRVDQFLPWKMSAERKRQFALPASYKRPG